MLISTSSSGNLNADRRFEYAQSLLAEKDFETALDLLKQTTELVPNWAPLWYTTGETYLQLANHDLAIIAFEKAIALDPTDRLGAGLRIAAITGDNPDYTMSHAFVAALFDQYADHFDAHLTKALHYQGPDIIFNALQQYCTLKNRNFHFERAADLGCGTGLMGAKIWQNVDALIGVDLSQQMVGHAQKRGFYSNVLCSDVVSYLASQQSGSFDLLIAADVLVYVGDLEPLFKQAMRALTQAGLLVFTAQSTEGEGYKLGPDMRYHHSPAFIKQTAEAAGIKVESLIECVTRLDAGKPVPSFVAILEAV